MPRQTIDRCTCGHEDSDGRGDVLACSVHGIGDYCYLCCECGVITDVDDWTYWAHDNDKDDGSLVQTSDGDDANLCPACGHYHRDDDSGAGIEDGSRRQLEGVRQSKYIAEGWGESWAMVWIDKQEAGR